MATASPIDRDAIVAAARETRGIVTVEEHTVRGGLGGAVAEVVVDATTRCRCASSASRASPDRLAEFLLEHVGLTASGIARAAYAVLGA